jgi:hypothetical protein
MIPIMPFAGRSRRRLILLVGGAAYLLLIGVVLEAGFAAYYRVRNRRFVSVARMLAEEQNTFIRQAKDQGKCTYLDTLFPHPYLAFVHHGNPPCGMEVNNVGLFGRDYPAERDPDHFTILLAGGSVAAQFSGLSLRAPNYLERVLNERYESPRGAGFQVLNGGDGAWKQPQQTILFLLHAQAVDAVVTLDGYNDLLSLAAGTRLEAPATSFLTVNPWLETGPRKLLGVWLYGAIYRHSQTNWVISHSYGAYGITRTVREAIRWWADKEPPGARRTTVSSIFSLPNEWDPAKRYQWNLEEYRKYMRIIDAVAARLRVRAAHFIQPVPAIGKTLAPEEARVVGDLSYADSYARMTGALLSLNGEGIPVFSLLDVFSGVREPIYDDHIHCIIDPKTGESRGYRMMAEHMADILAAQWHLRRRATPQPAQGAPAPGPALQSR